MALELGSEQTTDAERSLPLSCFTLLTRHPSPAAVAEISHRPVHPDITLSNRHNPTNSINIDVSPTPNQP